MIHDKIGIAIIQSLFDDERQTGKELYETTIKYIQYSKPFLESDFFDVRNKKEFFNVLHNILEIAKKENKFYFLHFEAHGNNKGIGMKNGELITWPELLPLFKKLNILYKNNLSVHLAVCEGNSLLRAINPIERSPFAFILGSFDKIYNYDILIAFEVFYSNFFNDFNIINAFNEMRKVSEKSDFSIISAWHIIDFIMELQQKVDIHKKILEAFDSTLNDFKEHSGFINTRKEIIKISEEFTIKREFFLMQDL